MTAFKKLTIIFLFLSSAFAVSANDTLSKIIDDKLSQGLAGIGKSISEIIPGEGVTEITISEQENYDLKYSALVVRPIFINPYDQLNNKHLYFTQLRIGNQEPFANGDVRTVLNAGLGFRTLTNNDSAVLGLNIFHDYEFDEGHQRGSIGVEYLASNFQLYANVYDRLSDSVSYTSGSSTILEEVVNGYDYSVVGTAPYLPWAKVIYTGYSWDRQGTDLEGNRMSLEANLLQGIVFEYGRNDIDNSSNDEDFYKLTFKWPNDKSTPTIFNETISENIFPQVDMSDQMLGKVRRTNNIITQKTGEGGVIITRGT